MHGGAAAGSRGNAVEREGDIEVADPHVATTQALAPEGAAHGDLRRGVAFVEEAAGNREVGVDRAGERDAAFGGAFERRAVSDDGAVAQVDDAPVWFLDDGDHARAAHPRVAVAAGLADAADLAARERD